MVELPSQSFLSRLSNLARGQKVTSKCFTVVDNFEKKAFRQGLHIY